MSTLNLGVKSAFLIGREKKKKKHSVIIHRYIGLIPFSSDKRRLISYKTCELQLVLIFVFVVLSFIYGL